MRICLTLILCTLAWKSPAADAGDFDVFFEYINALDFGRAKNIANHEPDSLIGKELRRMVNLLYFEGQSERPDPNVYVHDPPRLVLFLRSMNAGYESLYFDQVKGAAFRNFHEAFRLAKDMGEKSLIKASVLAVLKYYDLEIAQNSDGYQPYLQELTRLQDCIIDEFWVDLYKVIFVSKVIERLDESYFSLAQKLDVYERVIPTSSPLMAYLYYEKALRFELLNDHASAEEYYTRTIQHARDLPFLRPQRFFAALKKMRIAVRLRRFPLAKSYLADATHQAHPNDSLRSNYHLNLYHSLYLHAIGKDDSAYTMLMRAYVADFNLDFRRNALEINRLTVELDTREKENANLRLRQARIWLMGALVLVGLLFLASYLAYNNQLSKNRIDRQQKVVQAMQIEKMLKDQEIIGINSMIAGQEKERQRIAADLHDNLGSLLAALKLHFQTLKRSAVAKSNEISLFENVDGLIEEAYQKVRNMAHAKNVGVNAQDGLLPAVKQFAQKVSVQNRLSISVEDHRMVDRLENSLEILIFSVIQELVTNVIKHAQATDATIHLTHHETIINLMVEDNGVGFEPLHGGNEGMGLYSIQKRIERMGGSVTIDSIIGSGTTVIIDIPTS